MFKQKEKTISLLLIGIISLLTQGCMSDSQEAVTDIIVNREFKSGVPAFAALRANGSLVTWGNADRGGNSSAVEKELDGHIRVTKVFGGQFGMVALREDGSAVAWGNNIAIDRVNGSMQSYRKIDQVALCSQCPMGFAGFAAFSSETGSVITWAKKENENTIKSIQNFINQVRVVKVYSYSRGFVALRADGSMVFWHGLGSTTTILNNRSNEPRVTDIFTNDNADSVYALREDGSLKLVNDALIGLMGEDSTSNTSTQVIKGFYPFIPKSNASSFLAADNTHPEYKQFNKVEAYLNGAVKIRATNVKLVEGNLLVLRDDGSVVFSSPKEAWTYKVDNSSLNKTFSPNPLSGLADEITSPVTKIIANKTGFWTTKYDMHLIKSDGTTISGLLGPSGFEYVISKSLGASAIKQAYNAEGSNLILLKREDGTMLVSSNSQLSSSQKQFADKMSAETSAAKIINFGRDADRSLFALSASGIVYAENAQLPAGITTNTAKDIFIENNKNAVAVITTAGTVYTYGRAFEGGDSSMVANKLNSGAQVNKIVPYAGGFAAIKTDGSLVTWPEIIPAEIASKLDGISDSTQTPPAPSCPSSGMLFNASTNDEAGSRAAEAKARLQCECGFTSSNNAYSYQCK